MDWKTFSILLGCLATVPVFAEYYSGNPNANFGYGNPSYPFFNSGGRYGSYKCGLPNVIPRYFIDAISTTHGLFYGYLTTNREEAAQANYRYITTQVGNDRTLFPGTLESAEAQKTVATYFESPRFDDVTCKADYFLTHQSSGGAFFDVLYPSTAPDTPTPEFGGYLYINPHIVEIFAYCNEPDFDTGICRKPDIEVFTRIRPDYMTLEHRHLVNQIIDQVLAPYCFRASDLLPFTWVRDKPDCFAPGATPPPSDCFKSLLDTTTENVNSQPTP